MKTFYGYGESSYKRDWEYFKGFKYPSFEEISKNKFEDRGRIHIRYIGFCNKKGIIEIVGEIVKNKNWVRQRVCETHNKNEINLIKEFPNKIVVYIDEGILNNTIIALIDINTRKVEKFVSK